MKTLLWLLCGIMLLVGGCKHQEPQPEPTEINMMVVDENRKPLPKFEINIFGSTGCYFCGTRRDTIFANLLTGSDGKITYKKQIDSKWRVYTSPASFPVDSNGSPLYNDVRYEGTVDAIINVGQVNVITMILFKH